METIQWKKTNAKISLKQKRSLSIFKKKYSFLLTYSAEIIRDKTALELETSEAHQKALNKLEGIFPILDESALVIESAIEREATSNKVLSSTLFVKDVEVSQDVFEKYQHAKTLPLEYDELNPNTIKIY